MTILFLALFELGGGFVTASEMEILTDSSGRFYIMRDVSIYSEGVETTADSGIYDESELRAKLWGNIKVVGNGFVITSDTLIFHEANELMQFIGHSVFVDSAYHIEACRFEKLADTAKAMDSVYILLLDKNISIYGDSGFYFIDERRGRVCGSPKMTIPFDTSAVSVSSKSIEFTQDTLWAFGGVRIVAPDADGDADSAMFVSSDSTLRLWPNGHVRWDKGEASGKVVLLKFSNGRVSDLSVDEGMVYMEGESGTIRIKGTKINIKRRSDESAEVYASELHQGMFCPKNEK